MPEESSRSVSVISSFLKNWNTKDKIEEKDIFSNENLINRVISLLKKQQARAYCAKEMVQFVESASRT